jgi:hypothetical protein
MLMGDKPNYIKGYAVIRVEGPSDNPSPTRGHSRDGQVLPAAGPSHVTAKEVVVTTEEAQREVMRLNRLKAAFEGCCYYWQTIHVFLDGTSHGSALPAGDQKNR